MKHIEVVAAIICEDCEKAADEAAAVGEAGAAGTASEATASKRKRVFATQRGHGPQAGGWEFPGGKTEPGETPEAALAREIREELAVDVTVGRHVVTVDHRYDELQLAITMHCYLCEFAESDGSPTLLEHSAAKWVDAEIIDSLDWLPADVAVVAAIKEQGIV